MKVIVRIQNTVRSAMMHLARAINKVSRGRITPNSITWFGFLMHIPIAFLIVDNQLVFAAILLAIFGLMDALDGALARVQHKSSSAGMLLDASTDRFKEVILYTAAAYNLSTYGQASWAYLAVLACGAAISVSYVKAKGESAIATSGLSIDHAKLNRLFSDGLASFDIRIFIFIIGLLTNEIVIALSVIAVLSVATAFFRLFKITKALSA